MCVDVCVVSPVQSSIFDDGMRGWFVTDLSALFIIHTGTGTYLIGPIVPVEVSSRVFRMSACPAVGVV
jgi:hypothetical protein